MTAGRPDEILSWSGVWLDPFAPRPEQIRVRDIAHALSMLCRANGHFDRFYSVAQHSLNCAREAAAQGQGMRVQLACLLHDAAECYLSDLTRPVKRRFPLYQEAERRLQRVVFGALAGFWPAPAEWAQVGAVDDLLLEHEFWQLRRVPLADGTAPLTGGCDFAERPPSAVEREFLEQYRALSAQPQAAAQHPESTIAGRE